MYVAIFHEVVAGDSIRAGAVLATVLNVGGCETNGTMDVNYEEYEGRKEGRKGYVDLVLPAAKGRSAFGQVFFTHAGVY